MAPYSDDQLATEVKQSRLRRLRYADLIEIALLLGIALSGLLATYLLGPLAIDPS